MGFLQTGDVFQAVMDDAETKRFYRFYGMEFDSSKDCFYAVLQDLCSKNDNNEIKVEYEWFRKHKIRKLQPGMKVRRGNIIGKILPVKEDLLFPNKKVISLENFIRVEIIFTEHWPYDEIELI